MPNDQSQVLERTDAQAEADARLVGWQPETEFPGDKAKWKPAREFLQMAESQLPMARYANKRLTETNQELLRRLKAQETAMTGLQESIDALKEFHSTDTKRKVEEAREKLLGELKAARAAGDADAEVEIIDALTQAKAEEPAKKPATSTTSTVGPTPEWKAWEADNPKFHTDKKWRGVCIGMAEEMRVDPRYDHLQGRAFFDEVARETDAWFAQRSTAARVDKTESGGGAGTNGAGNTAPRGKGYNQLPPDAKAQCEKDSKKFVGKSEQFKTLEKWRDYFSKVYWENE